MNDHSTVISSSRFQSRRPRIWVSRSGAVVASAGTRTPKRASVGWEAYVVDTVSQQAVEGYPRQKGTDVIEVNDQNSNNEIQKLYLARCATAPDLDFDLLSANVDIGTWCISTHITAARPL